MTGIRTLLVLIDVEGVVAEAELRALLPSEPIETLRMTLFGCSPLDRTKPVPWSVYGAAIERLAERARTLARETGNPPAIYVGGRGPLGLFVHLGQALQRFSGPQTFLQHDGSSWAAHAFSDSEDSEKLFFDRRQGLDDRPRIATGRVAVYVDTGGRPPSAQAFRSFFDDHSERLADVVELRTSENHRLLPGQAARVGRELVEQLPRVPSLFPHASGLALFVAGPAVVAFAVGRALTASIFSSVWLTQFNKDAYELVYALPFCDASKPARPPSTDADKLARRQVRDGLQAAIASLQKTLELKHVKGAGADTAFITRLRSLEQDDTERAEFRLSILDDRIGLGEGLLEALRHAPPETLKDFGQLLILHELRHVQQGLRSTNFPDVGRAGFVLEQVDCEADTFALAALFEMHLSRGGAAAREKPGVLLHRLVGAIIFGIEAFDRMNHPLRIDPLPERRLRRYLLWHMQLARARAVRTATEARRLLASRVTVELAPLPGQLDARFDKILTRSLPSTEFFAAVDGRLIRHARAAGFDPEPLVEAVRTYNHALIQNAFEFIVEAEPSLRPRR